MKQYGSEKLYFLLFIFVAFLVVGSASASFAMTLGCRGFVTNGVDDVDGLNFARSVAISPDGNSLYAVGSGDNAVVVFSRDNDNTETPGALNFIEVEKNGVNEVSGLWNASSVTVSPDTEGKHVYVTGYAAGASDPEIAVFNRASPGGELDFIYAQNNGSADDYGLHGVDFVTISPDGKYLYTAADLNNAISVFSRDNDNSATPGALDFVEKLQDDIGDINTLAGCSSIAISPDGRYLYTAARWDDAVTVFARDMGTGKLGFIEAHILTTPGDIEDEYFGPLSVTVSPDGNHLYVAGTENHAILAYNRDADTGKLTFPKKQKDGVNGVDGLEGAFFVDVSPDGKHLYAIGNLENAVAMFSRDESTGVLSYLEMQKDDFNCNGLNSPRSLIISPDNNHLYVTGALDHAVAIFSILYTPAELAAERDKWDANDDNKIGLEEAIQALQITSGL